MKVVNRFWLSSSERAAIRRIRLPRPIARCMKSAVQDSDQEVCGLLFGSIQADELLITRWQICKNHAKSGNEFLIDIDELLDVVKQKHHYQAPMVALCHSHPTDDLRLSVQDHMFLTLSPFLWATFSCAMRVENPSLKFFRFSQIGIDAVPYTLVEQ